MRFEHNIEKINRDNFRSSLEALSRPGEMQPVLPLFNSGLLAMASVLLYAEVSHYYAGNLDFDMVRALTGSEQSSQDGADYLFFDAPHPEQLNLVKRGTAENPESSATLIYDLTTVTEGVTKVQLSGPGIQKKKESMLPLSNDFITELMRVNKDFPFGVDLLLICSGNNLVGLPRTTRIEVVL